jgi:transcriptional regulator
MDAAVLIRPHDAARSEAEWLAFLATHDFGQLVVAGRDREAPVIVPTHFVVTGPREAIMHFARPNPVFEALAADPRATLAVVGDYAFIPGTWNADEDAPAGYGIPTSYYGAVQLAGDATVVDDPAEMASLLAAMMAHFQPEGGHAPVEPGKNYFGRHFGAIRGVRLAVREVKAKFKYGGNRTPDVRARVAAGLAARGGPQDAAVRARLLSR